jgi:hypothetical protein
MRWRERTQAAFLFSWRSIVTARLMDASRGRPRGIFPLSITYAGRCRS